MSLSSSQADDEDKSRPAFTFTARSNLPIGAGLGSSASYSVCLSTSFLLLFSRITVPAEPLPSSSPSPQNPAGHTHVRHNGRKALPKELADEVNKWAFIAEKVLHGNPSGVDNSVASYGGALAFTRAGFEESGRRKGGLESIQGRVILSLACDLYADDAHNAGSNPYVSYLPTRKSREIRRVLSQG